MSPLSFRYSCCCCCCCCWLLFVFLFISPILTLNNGNWDELDDILNRAIVNGAFPGAAAIVADESGVLYYRTVGYTTYPSDGSPLVPMSSDILFDMASVSKVIACTSAVALLYQGGIIPSLSLCVSHILPEYGVKGKEGITIENLLLHNSGLKPDPVPGYFTKQFGCLETDNYHPNLAYTCMDQIYKATMEQPIVNPIGEVYAYSDLSMISLMYVVGYYVHKYRLVLDDDLMPTCKKHGSEGGFLSCYYEAFVRNYIIEALNMSNSKFITIDNVKSINKSLCAPGWNETTGYRHEIIQGYVSDENAYANGGISGHAGLFSSIMDVYKFCREMMFPSPYIKGNRKSKKLIENASAQYSFLSPSIIELFTTIKNATQSSRALGWDTNYGHKPYPEEYHSCGTLSPETYLHLGFSGTQICMDPKRKLFTILLTNRVYPDKDNNKIRDVRAEFNAAVQRIYDNGKFYRDSSLKRRIHTMN
jgi:CubicO group peptidase (beta-lactamase class C family)